LLRTDFLMIVTPVDLAIARYTIPALARLVGSSECIHAVIYCNGLAPGEVADVEDLIRPYRRFTCRENSARMHSIGESIRVGEWYTTDAGNKELREGRYENCGEIWSRELVQLEGDLVGLIDADFEIFDIDFARRIIEAFSSDRHLGVFSTEHRLRVRTLESYSGEEAIVADLYATWFCVYRRAALEKDHDFTYTESREDGQLPVMYDHSAKLQEALVRDHGFTARSFTGEYTRQYLHYGAFAKNRSLRGRGLAFYRFLRIGAHNGWIHRLKNPVLALGARALAYGAWTALRMSRFDTERRRYLFDEQVRKPERATRGESPRSS
jgi:hypothetical protein